MKRGGSGARWVVMAAACAVWSLPAVAQTATQPATDAGQPAPATPQTDPATPPAEPTAPVAAPAPDVTAGATTPAQPQPDGTAATPAEQAAQPAPQGEANAADLTATASSQEGEPRKRRRRRGPDRAMNTVSANVAMVPWGVYTVAFERALTERFSLNVDAVGAWISKATPRGRTTITGLGIEVDFRIFVLGTAPAGLFAGPLVRVENLNVRETISGSRGTAGALGGEVGYSYIAWKRLYLGASGGAYASLGPVSLNGTQISGFGWRPFLKLNVGFAF